MLVSVRMQKNQVTIVPIIKVVKDVIQVLKDVANNQNDKDEEIVNQMIRLRTTLETDHEGFMDIFVE